MFALLNWLLKFKEFDQFKTIFFLSLPGYSVGEKILFDICTKLLRGHEELTLKS